MLDRTEIDGAGAARLDETLLASDALPAENPGRWVIRRKAQVLAAIASGLLTVEDACKRYCLSIEELTSWQRLFELDGIAGLRVTRTGQYRCLHRHF